MIKLTLDKSGESVAFNLVVKLGGGDRFRQFVALCRECGATWDGASGVNRAPLNAVPLLLQKLLLAEFPVDIDPNVNDALTKNAENAANEFAGGRIRLERALSVLDERNKTIADESKRFKLYNYQKTGIEWLATRRNGVLCDQMGLGKTVQALLALPDNARVITVVPAGVRYSWVTETHKWRPDLSVFVGSARGFRWPRQGEFIVMNYGLLPESESMKTMMAPPGPIHLIADEAHLLKNKNAQRRRKWDELVNKVVNSGGVVWLITGTPLLNRPDELWNVLDAAHVAHDAFGNKKSFDKMFGGWKNQWGGMSYNGKVDVQVPLALRKVSLCRRRDEVLPDLPKKTREDIEVDISKDPEAFAICNELVRLLEEEGKTVDDILDGMGDSIIFEMISKMRAAVALAKIPAMLEVVESYEEQEEPLIVFSAHKAPLEVLAKRPGWKIIIGDVSADERGAIVKEFQEGKLNGIGGTIQAMGVGVTLTHACNLLFVDMMWTPALNQQAEDRSCRIGQKSAVLIKRLIANHVIDQRVIELLTKKIELIEKSVDASAVSDKPVQSDAEAIAKVAQDAATYAKRHEELLERSKRQAASRAPEPKPEWESTPAARFREARNSVERHAHQAILQLAAMDDDHASVQNGMGFSQMDNGIGHSFADSLKKYGRLSDRQWAAACRIAHRYRRQVGEPPTYAEEQAAKVQTDAQ